MNGVAVVGGGSWGTGLTWLIGRRGLPVTLWARDPELVAAMRRTRVNQRYLPGVELPAEAAFTDDLTEAVTGREMVIVAVPSVGVPAVAEALAPLAGPGAVVVSAAKGLDHRTGRRMTIVLGDALGDSVAVAALSGPNLAHEIVAGQPSASVAASLAPGAAVAVQDVLSCDVFRVYTSTDVAGVELGGALKNPLAIAAGICDGLGFGDNSKAALMTRGMHEIRRLGTALGAAPQTFSGLCGFGDLMATCHSRLSRNRNLGEQLGRGRPLAEVLAETSQVAEGVPTTRTAVRLAGEHGVSMPIIFELHDVLFRDRPVREAVRALMARDIADEFR